jgi:hypothetical protein
VRPDGEFAFQDYDHDYETPKLLGHDPLNWNSKHRVATYESSHHNSPVRSRRTPQSPNRKNSSAKDPLGSCSSLNNEIQQSPTRKNILQVIQQSNHSPNRPEAPVGNQYWSPSSNEKIFDDMKKNETGAFENPNYDPLNKGGEQFLNKDGEQFWNNLDNLILQKYLYETTKPVIEPKPQLSQSKDNIQNVSSSDPELELKYKQAADEFQQRQTHRQAITDSRYKVSRPTIDYNQTMDKQEKRSLKKKLEEEVEASLQHSPPQSQPRPVSQWDDEPLPAHYKEPPLEPNSPEPLSPQEIHTTEDGLDVIEHQGSFKLNNQTGFEEEYCEPEKAENSIFGHLVMKHQGNSYEDSPQSSENEFYELSDIKEESVFKTLESSKFYESQQFENLKGDDVGSKGIGGLNSKVQNAMSQSGNADFKSEPENEVVFSEPMNSERLASGCAGNGEKPNLESSEYASSEIIVGRDDASSDRLSRNPSGKGDSVNADSIKGSQLGIPDVIQQSELRFSEVQHHSAIGPDLRLDQMDPVSLRC